MQKLLAALGDNVKPRGKDYIARCPVHNDKDFAMSIKQVSDGSVIAYCFACQANGVDLYKALGLDLDELFGGKKGDFIPQAIKDQLSEDKMFIAIYESDVSKGVNPKLSEKRRYRLALARSEGIKTKFNIV
tara:strand:+ start:111 stop:503 length:393 start_codon:yes stop_codon:yes gene_type:complete